MRIVECGLRNEEWKPPVNSIVGTTERFIQERPPACGLM
jgi:hypothetical protein